MIRYDGETALVVVDVQNDFADPAGSLYVRDGEQVIPVANEQVERATIGRFLRRLLPGLAPGLDTALPERGRAVAGALREGLVGLELPPRPAGRR